MNNSTTVLVVVSRYHNVFQTTIFSSSFLCFIFCRLFLEILSVASASCDQAEVFRDGQWRCINKELDFTVTLIAPKEKVKEEMVKREKVSQPRSAPGTTKINRTMSLPSSSSQSSKSSKMDDAQLIGRMAEGVSRVVKITEKEEQDEATDKALKVPNDNASLIKSKKRSAEVKSTSPFKPNIPLVKDTAKLFVSYYFD